VTARALLWVPLPPPYAGPEVASQTLVYACRDHFPEVLIENASLRTANMEKGRFNWSGIRSFMTAYRRFVRTIRKVDTVCLVAAANTTGCLRDAALIATARLMRKSIVLHLRGGRYAEYYADSSAPMKRLLRFAWGSASRAIVQAPRLSDVLREAAPHVEVIVLPNGLRGDELPPKSTYVTEQPRILFVGHLTYFKGFYDLMHAFRELRARRPDTVLVCAGELPDPQRSFVDFLPRGRQAFYLKHRHEICAEIRSFVEGGAANGVEYAGIVSGQRKIDLFRSSDLFVLPSYTEGFSLALLEALFHGLPVVTTNVGGSPDIVKTANGILIEPGDVDGLVNALDELISDPDRRQALGRRNAREAREHYDVRIVAKRLASILKGDSGAWINRESAETRAPSS